jgi:hypothetical protein
VACGIAGNPFQESSMIRPLPLIALAAGGVLAYFYVRSEARTARQRRRGIARTDEAIGADVRASLERIVATPGDIEVAVHDGVVALRGAVPRNRRDRVLRAALSIPGVKSVANRLELESGPGIAEDQPGEPDILEEWPAPSASTRSH